VDGMLSQRKTLRGLPLGLRRNVSLYIFYFYFFFDGSVRMFHCGNQTPVICEMRESEKKGVGASEWKHSAAG
jgi:hypothetical protein